MMKRRLSELFWPDARGWIAIGIFGLTILLILMMRDRSMREDEFFQTIATVIISNGLMGIVAWGFSATKGGGEQAQANADLAKTLVEKHEAPPNPLPVEVTNTSETPVPVATNEELPSYAQP